MIILRLEELAPFPFAALGAQLAALPAGASVVWAQEEPKNMGAWAYVEPRLRATLKALGPQARALIGGLLTATLTSPPSLPLITLPCSVSASHILFGRARVPQHAAREVAYAGRPVSASPATAQFELHNRVGTRVRVRLDGWDAAKPGLEGF